VSRFQVVIPSLNQGAFVAEAVRSVLGQRAEVDVELVVVDGCSTDDTLVRLDEVREEHPDAPLRVLSEPDSGQAAAINKGVRLGDGEIVSWLGADDRLLPGALSAVQEAFAAAPADTVAVYGDMRVIDAQGAVVGEQREGPFSLGDLLWGPNFVPQVSTFVRRAAWEEAGGVREELRYAMDYDLWLRLGQIGGFVHLPQLLADFRLHPASKTGSAYGAMLQEAMDVRREHATALLGRRPSTLELEGRRFLKRCRRRIGRGFRAARPHAGRR
jgi:glycosyltransferase involved in cell wall biosynthesis